MSSSNSGWKPGQKIVAPFSGMVSLAVEDLAPHEMYKAMIGAIVPRPIAFVSTISASGAVNLAPFSFFNGVSSRPPLLMISIAHKRDGAMKDTLRNLLEVDQFVVNIVSEWFVEAMVHCAAEYPYGVDEMQKVGLTPLASGKIRPPRVAESAAQFECVVHQMVPILDDNEETGRVVFGRIVGCHFANTVYIAGRIDVEALKPVARLGGFRYAGLQTSYEVPIPDLS